MPCAQTLPPAVHPVPAAALAQRAYEVWISEVMLQQTRVAVVPGEEGVAGGEGGLRGDGDREEMAGLLPGDVEG
ncbi:hypothetical protein NEMBOFW57_010940 [Staphylotrichum longicolle]|uniref:Uncharacterized protein n=1 Tax=Staphylotrichum longicolle TaxID=669026 RepID=A0AAD4ENL3_9PEZI|nr:hypothetical protein NEMBOFW57_010940 [Staphylotrichum longicolle]